MALKDERSPKYAFPGAGTSLLKSPRKSLLYTFLGFSTLATACMLLCPQRHGPPGRGNTMALKDERNPKYAFPGAGTSLLKSPRKSCYTCLYLLYVSRLLDAAVPTKTRPTCLYLLYVSRLLDAAVPTKTRPSRTGKHHGPEGRTESKIRVSRGRKVSSEIS